MRLLEAAPRTAGVSGDERATLVIATQLLRDIVQRHAETEGHLAPSPRSCRRWMHWNSCPPPLIAAQPIHCLLPFASGGGWHAQVPDTDRTTGAAGCSRRHRNPTQRMPHRR